MDVLIFKVVLVFFFLCVYAFQTPFSVTQSGTPEQGVMDGDEEQKMTAKVGVMLLGSQLLLSLPGSGLSHWVEHIHTCTFLAFETQGNAAAIQLSH